MLKKKRMNMVRILFILTLLAMLSVSIYIANNSTKTINEKKKINLLAQDGDIIWDISATTSDHVTATLSTNGTLTISGNGKMKDFSLYDYQLQQNVSTAPWYESRELIKTIKIETGTTNISNSAFYKCSSLTSIELSTGVTSIEKMAFLGCSSLTSIEIPGSVTHIENGAFSRCESLTSIKIPSGVTKINGTTFSRCSSLRSIEIPESVTNIGDYAFNGCSSLTSIEIPESVTSIGYGAFSDCSNLTSIGIPQSVTNIGNAAFSGCSSLTSIKIPSGMTSINDLTFSECTSLTNVEIPPSVTSIGDSTFAFCENITSIKIPSRITRISDCTFQFCTRLSSIEIPEGVTSIGQAAFEECRSLTSIEIPESVTSIGYGAFSDCSNLTSIGIPQSVTNIGDAAFYNCSSLTSIEIPEGVTIVGNSVLSKCSNLTSIVLPTGVTSIGRFAFNKCSSLTSIEIPSGVTSIGEKTFAECTDLKNVKLPNSIHSVCKNAFYGCSSISKIEAESERGYQIEGWYENEEFTVEKLENLPVNSDEDTMLYAKWTPIEYTITYNLAGGSLLQGKSNPGSYTIETANFTLNNPVKTGYTFTGWTGSNGTTKQTQVTISKGSTGNKEYTANWKANTYTITYNGNGETGGSTAKSTHEYNKEKALTANGFTKSYTITYNHNYQGSQNETRTVNLVFSKWNTKADGTETDYEDKQVVKNLTTKNGENINLYAQWENTSEEVTYVPERTGYTFAGWYTNSELTGERVDKQKAGSYTPTSSITLYAKWTPIEYTITYDLAGGSLPQGKSNPGSYTIETETFTLNNPQKEGYTFTGWTESNSQTPEISVTIEKGSTGNKAYTANWKKKVELQITIDSKYEIKEEDGVKYITNIEPNTTIEAFLLNQETRKIETNGEIKLYKENKEIDYLADGVGTPLLGTGYRIEITLEDKKQEYIAVVKGDLTGNGKIDQGDLLMLAKYKVGKLVENASETEPNITRESVLASDLNSNGSNSDQGDLLMIAKILVGKFVN